MARATTSRGARSFQSGEYFAMNALPSGDSSTPPSPRTASLIRKPSAPGTANAVGWNWMYSALTAGARTAYPALLASASPSPREPGGLVVLR